MVRRVLCGVAEGGSGVKCRAVGFRVGLLTQSERREIDDGGRKGLLYSADGLDH